jgi:hypothetical protein
MCNCKKGRALQEVPKSEPTPEPIPQPQQEDWYNNIDIIEPIPQTPDELLTQELNNWNGGQTKN